MGSIPTTLQGAIVIPPVNFIDLKVESFDEKFVLAGDEDVTPQFLAKWIINRDPNETLPKQIKSGGHIQALIIRDTGAGFISIGLVTSTDDITYSTGALISSRNVASFANTTDAQSLTQDTINDSQTHFGIAIFNNDALSTGRIKEFSVKFQLWLPLNYSITKLI